MESILKDEQGAEQEADGSERSVTSTCRRTNEADRTGLGYETVMDTDSDLLENLKSPNLEMLTNETINAGTQASVSPRHKETSQRSFDTSPSNDNTQGICEATLLGDLESSPAVVETTAEDRNAEPEMRHPKEESETSFKELEASSDGTDEWETASEESGVLDREPCDLQEIIEDIGSYGQEMHNEKAGHHGQKTIMEEDGPHSQEMVIKDHGHRRREDTVPQSEEKRSEEVGLPGIEIICDESEPNVYKTISEEDKPHEAVSEEAEPYGHETVNEDIGLQSPETVKEDMELHGQERVKEDTQQNVHDAVSDEAGPRRLETVNEEDEPHCRQIVEDAWPNEHDTVSKDAEAHLQETASKEAEPCNLDTVSKEAGFQGQETVREEVEPHGQEKVETRAQETVTDEVEIHAQETVIEEVETHAQETVTEQVEPHVQETLTGEVEPHAQEMVTGEVEPHAQETVTGEVEPHAQEMVTDEVEPHAQETITDEVEIHAQETVTDEVEPHVQETITDEVEPHAQETVTGEVEPHAQETVTDEVEPHAQETVTDEVEPHAQETVSDEVEPHAQETVTEEVEPHAQETVTEEVEPHVQETVTEEVEPHAQETVTEEVEPHAQETVTEEVEPHGQGTATDEVEPHGQGSAPDEVEPHGQGAAPDEVEPHGQGTATDEVEPHGQGTATDEVELHGLDMLSNEAEHGHIETDIREVSLYSQGTYDDDIGSYALETVSEEAGPHGQVSSEERVGPLIHETVGHLIMYPNEETVREFVRPLGNETVSDVTRPYDHSAELEVPDNETVGGMESAEFDECKIGLNMDNINAVLDQVLGGNMVTENEGTSEDTFFISTTKTLDENEMNSVEKLESRTDEIKSEDVNVETFSDGTQTDPERHPHEAQEGYIETMNEEVSNVCIETFHKETKPQEIQEIYEGIDSQEMQGMYKETFSEHILQETPDSENTNVLDVSFKTLERMKEVTSEERIVIEPFNEEREMADTQAQMKSNEDCELNDDLCEALRVFEKRVTNDHEMDDDLKVYSSTSLQNEQLGCPKPPQIEKTTLKMLDSHRSPGPSLVDQRTHQVQQDELDNYTLEFFPMSLKGVGIVSRNVYDLDLKSKSNDLSLQPIDAECIEAQETCKETVHQEATPGDTHSMSGLDQDTMTLTSEIAKTTDTDIQNIKLYKRQRSNTDPHLNFDKDEKLQSVSNSEGSPRGRLRSVTPPCDKFTSSYTPTSTQTLEQTPTSVLYPMPDEQKTSHTAQDPTSKKEHTFFPTQIFNPMLLLGHMQESGFYQGEKISPDKIENPSNDQKDDPVLLNIHNPEGIFREPKISTEEISNTKTMLPPSGGPVWLPPQPKRYASGINDIRSLKSQENPLMRRATIRHKKSNVGVKPTTKRFSNPNLPSIPQRDNPMGPITSNLPKVQSMNISQMQISSRHKQLPHQQRISEETGQSRHSSSMTTVREEEHHTSPEKPSNSPEFVVLRASRSKITPPSSESSQSIHRRYSTFINSSNLLYQEYSDVALNQEIQRQKPGDSPAEDSQPSSPRVRRRILSSQESYLQRLSISSADSLWQDIPKIRDSVTFLSMTREEQKLQEAKFELIMSEALYLRSLNIAVDHFQHSAELQEMLTAQDRQWLFSRLSEVRDASSDFLFDLEEEFENNMYNFQVCDVVIAHEPNFRRVYLPYVTNQSYQDRTFQRLMSDTPRFQQVLARLESDPVCQRLSLKSFLILPFQRITRLRLLLQNILKRSAPGSTEELQATQAHNALGKLIRDCNESVQRMKDTEELILLNQRIQFECKIFPLISQSRRLVKHGEVTALEFNSKWKVSTRPVYLHLFNDCLLLSRVREGGRFVVFDHASEFRVERCQIKLHSNQKNIFRVFLRDSAAMGRESRETEFIFRTETQSQKLRWICALSTPKEEIDFMTHHGLSQMQCLKSYKARENDELSLEKADILMITQNSDDGWLRGIRLSDQQSGWFPESNVQPISRNACIRNLQEEQRLQTARAKLQPSGAKGH